MSTQLPDINPRSHTPVSSRSKNLKMSPLKIQSAVKSVRNISLTPMSISSVRNNSSSFSINPRTVSDSTSANLRTVSDELHPYALDKDPLFRRINSLLEKPGKNLTRHPISSYFDKTKSFTETIDALLIMYNCERGRIYAYNLAQLFISLGYCEDCEVIFGIFRDISEGQPFNMISYSKAELLKICEDVKTDNVLKAILKDMKAKPILEKLHGVHMLVAVIKRWWARLDKSKNGFVSFEDICTFYTEIGVIENASDIKRIFLKISQYANYSQFIRVFAKSLLKYLLIELTKVVKKGSDGLLSAEIAISAQRRKVMLNSLEGGNKIVDTVIECNIFNNN